MTDGIELRGGRATKLRDPSLHATALAASYARADYRVESSAGLIEFRIGERSTALDSCLRLHQCRRAALITAANPASEPLSESENLSRHLQFTAQLEAQNRRWLPAESSSPEGKWLERGLFVLDLGEDEAVALARKLGQAALILVEVGHPVRILWT